MNNNLFVYKKQPTVSGSIKVTVRPTTIEERFEERLVCVAELCVINQIAEDYATRLANIKIVKENYRQYSNGILWRFNDISRKMKRVMKNKEQADHFSESICNVVSECEANVEVVEKMMITELVQKVSYEYIESVFCVGFVGGLVEVLESLHMRLYGKSCEEYKKIKSNLEFLDDNVSIHLLNNNKKPDMNVIDQYIEKMFDNIRKNCKEFVKKSQEERKCLNATLTD